MSKLFKQEADLGGSEVAEQLPTDFPVPSLTTGTVDDNDPAHERSGAAIRLGYYLPDGARLVFEARELMIRLAPMPIKSNEPQKSMLTSSLSKWVK
jgi:hypothetical protein